MSQTRYRNPLLPTDFPDPSVIALPEGGYAAYATHDEFSPTLDNILLSYSPDLINWSTPVGALREPPVWARQCRRYWCPQVVPVAGRYRLYYAADSDAHDGMYLALALSDTPADFVDIGRPLLASGGSAYAMIDPCFFADPKTNRHYLYYGSAHQPIRAVELAPDGFTFVGAPVDILPPLPGVRYETLREGAFVTYRPEHDRYFLWVSGDNTWAEGGYAVSVYWSAHPLRGFAPIPEPHIVLKPGPGWDAPGQNCVVTDAAGQDWLVYHAVDPADRYIPGTDRFKRKMCMDPVYYTPDGWPFVAGGSPSIHERDGPVVSG